jgi:hypothetical protein
MKQCNIWVDGSLAPHIFKLNIRWERVISCIRFNVAQL